MNLVEIPADIAQVCHRLSQVTYENLTKIIRYDQGGSADRAQQMDDSFHNDLDQWMGGGTCFAITWHLYQELQTLGYAPQLLMGHKRKERNVHCALRLEAHGVEWFMDPGYMIFDPIAIPLPLHETFVPLLPNQVRLVRQDDLTGLALWTGSAQQPFKLRFEFPYAGVDVEEFRLHWRQSFSFAMMRYPVLNRLDRELGVQYYFQKENLVIRDAQGSRLQRIAPENQVQSLAEIFRLEPQVIQQALGILRKI